MSKISQEQASRWSTLIVAERFKEEVAQQEHQEDVAAKKARKRIYGKSADLADALPRGWLHLRNYVGRASTSLHFLEAHAMPWDQTIEVLTPEEIQIAHKGHEICQRHRDITNEVRRMLLALGTTKRIIEDWPEAANILKLANMPKSEKTSLAVQINPINKLLGF
jgi:hypothetical protein